MDALPAEASCPICLEYFRDPVSIHCGHHFCRSCIERCWEWSTAGFACPRCRDTAPQRSLRPSRELARVLEIARRLSRGEALGSGDEEEEGCRRHREPLEVFCKEDGALLCAICRESRAHRAHTVLPLPEAVREYREQIQARLQTLKDDREKLLEFREAEMKRNWEYLFQGLRLSLEELSRHLLARLGDLESDIGKVQEENVTSLTKEISRLDTRVQELEEKCQQPARTFLQDISGTLTSLGKENLQLPPSPLPELEKKIHHFREENILLEETLRSFQDILMFELPEKMTVTLDPGTAHPQLLVAPDGSSVSWESARDPPGDGAGAGTGTDPPADGPGPGPGPEPGTDPSVLGREGVTAGRRCWDVQVAPAGSWALGVARETLGSGAETPGSEAETPGSSEWELWSMGLCQGQFWALTSLERIPLFPIRAPSRVRVALDYEGGQVAFFDADKRSLIFAFPAASFKGQSIHPWFLVWGEGSRITLCR
ncbi:E3 ubiquitin-protein ligase TRIM7-like [Parus major]|uniref:E3 ubiquitin-protein ligase TRIM7-like n=1 Tax=Parus major TaxID=9157 RepID=UPI0014442AD7|nr:E3 ubiquitin-protein ligase TRIM7-like [Parus major]